MNPRDTKIAIILGTRPEIIKMSPIIRECERLNLNWFILHTGQHYSYYMDKVFLTDCNYRIQYTTLALAQTLTQKKLAKRLLGQE